MAGYRVRVQLIIFTFVLIIMTLVIYMYMHSALLQASHVFPQWEVDIKGEFPRQPHPREGDTDRHPSHKSSDVELGLADQQPGRGRCSATVTILIPGIYPFRAWREYSLLWQELSQSSSMLAGTDLPMLHLQCPMQRCDVDIRVTMEEAYLNTTDAIVVNMFPNILKKKLLKLLSHLRQVLNPNVHWFFYGVESPQMMAYWDPNIKDIQYHHSITYHTDADIRLPYGKYLPNRSDEPRAAGPDQTANKTGLIAWMASNCKNTFWPRNEFVHELAKYIPLDMYGKCGNLTCLPAMSDRCTNLMASYKFYLSLENAECDQYVTEKVWSNSLLQGAVPVVYGGRKEAYERLLPPESFIHIGDFDSLQSLASHLRLLDQNPNMYNAYHAWRKHDRVEMVYPPLDSRMFCEVVPFVLSSPPPLRTVKDSSYYRGCKSLTSTFAEEGSLRAFKPWK